MDSRKTAAQWLRGIVAAARPVQAEAVRSRIGVGFSHGYGTKGDEKEFDECERALVEWQAASDLLEDLLGEAGY